MNKTIECKIIRIDDIDAFWQLPLEFIADHRAKYYAGRDKETTYQDEFDYIMDDCHEGLDWMLNNMDWEDYCDAATLVKKKVALKPSKQAQYRIIKVKGE